MTKVDYIMDDAREAKRLADKVDATAWADRYILPHLGQSHHILDVGCGPGVIASAIAQALPLTHTVGVDLSSDRVESYRHTLPPNVELKEADARSLPFADDSFDFVYCRFLLEYLIERQKAISEMVRVCRPGGRILLQDLDGQLLWHYPEDPELQDQLAKVFSGVTKSGFDPFVGRKLFWLAKVCGLRDIEVKADSYHLYAGAIDKHNFRLWETKLEIAMPIATKALGSVQAAESLKKRFLDFLLREDTLTYSILFTVIGTKS